MAGAYSGLPELNPIQELWEMAEKITDFYLGRQSRACPWEEWFPGDVRPPDSQADWAPPTPDPTQRGWPAGPAQTHGRERGQGL